MLDRELEELRAAVDCRTVLEQAGWELDARESTKHAPKYRNGSSIVVVTHEGKGWFAPLDGDKGDVIALAQFVWGGSIGHARKALRPIAGIAPALTPTFREKKPPAPLDAPRAWAKAHKIGPQTQGWAYLTGKRGLPVPTLTRIMEAGLLREGIYGTVWFLHRTSDAQPCGWEMRGPKYKGFSTGGHKALFWVGDLATAERVAVVESAIDALSLATLEKWPADTAYVSTGGGFGPLTENTLTQLLAPGVRIVAATDQGRGGEILADRLHELARAADAGFSRRRPEAKDWNAQLTGEGA